MIDGDSITPVDAAGIPTGELMAVAGTEYDFRTLQPLGGRIGELKKGYDTNYKLNKQPGTLALAAKISRAGIRSDTEGVYHRTGYAVLYSGS